MDDDDPGELRLPVRKRAERVVPSKEIDHAVERKKRFETNPAKHTYEEA